MPFQTSPPGQVLGTGKRRLCAGRHDAVCRRSLEFINQPQPEPHGRWMGQSFQRAIDIAVHHVSRPHLYLVLPGVLHQLGGRVKPQWLAVEHGGQEFGRVMPFDPAAGVDQQGKRGGMALGKTIFTEPLDLLEDADGELFLVTPIRHAIDDLVVVLLQPALAFPSRHGASQAIGLAGGKSRRKNGDLHHLFLEHWHAQGAPQRLPQCLTRVNHRLLALAPVQVGMHHAALDRAGPHNRHLDHQVIKTLGPQSRQHAHLGPALDLEHTDGVSLADHGVGLGVFGRNVLHPEDMAFTCADEA